MGCFEFFNPTNGFILRRLFNQTMKFQLFTGLCLLCGVLGAQELQRSVLAAGGSSQWVETSQGVFYVSQTVGQAGAIGVVTRDGLQLRQGFQQPPLMVIQSSEDMAQIDATIYPNPTSYQLNIALGSPIQEPVMILLFDTVGRSVMMQEYKNGQQFELDVSGLNSGVYVLQIEQKGQLFTRRIIKN